MRRWMDCPGVVRLQSEEEWRAGDGLCQELKWAPPLTDVVLSDSAVTAIVT